MPPRVDVSAIPGGDVRGTFLLKVVGGTMALLGAGALGLALWVTYRLWLFHRLENLGGLAFVAVCTITGAFFFRTGVRLVTNRPSRYGSLLTPVGWRIVGGVFALFVVFFAAVGLRGGMIGFAVPAVVAACLSIICLRVAPRLIQVGDNRGHVFPVETSLLSYPQLIPAGFKYGVEILNDSSTPMEFVVSILEAELGLSRTEAIRTMLMIHSRGGVLLSLPSLAEAHRTAEAVTALATAASHPLVCRSVDGTR